ncbi:hypothetical protein P691DRAFT_788149 [Macrolepiota fuliginosa MF-IS2]|uniref:Uncharacterized protein n=1 Tax=Macrolepiota fuliginosa MF-IS2 TaxID=1400762 RepID=A0A9P5X4R6_9AGAR|nr:hypothetical protein P691DRAFT_788149 [Macrolepiota fuliginosa MF-IS2]
MAMQMVCGSHILHVRKPARPAKPAVAGTGLDIETVRIDCLCHGLLELKPVLFNPALGQPQVSQAWEVVTLTGDTLKAEQLVSPRETRAITGIRGLFACSFASTRKGSTSSNFRNTVIMMFKKILHLKVRVMFANGSGLLRSSNTELKRGRIGTDRITALPFLATTMGVTG